MKKTKKKVVRKAKPIPIKWGAKSPRERGPVIATLGDPHKRNSIGVHVGTYAIQRAIAIAAGTVDPVYNPDLSDTYLTDIIRPNPNWFEADKIVSIDPFGAVVTDVFADYIEKGYHIHPTIAITKAHIQMPEVQDAIKAGRLKPDGQLLKKNGECVVTKAAIEPVWYLPGVAKRFGVKESVLRHTLYEKTGGMFPDLVSCPDLKVFLPPIGGMTVYIFGDVNRVGDVHVPLTARVHDECSGSDVFGSDICTCRPYLAHAIEECIRGAQRGGSGVFIYYRNEGRAMGEVNKYLIYNARKRQKGGDRAEKYFDRAICIAGTSDLRLYALMPDVLHWLGITKIDRLVSMSNLKYGALVNAGIKVVKRIALPKYVIPPEAYVEIDAKVQSGYHTEGAVPDQDELSRPKGRELDV